MDNKTEFSVLNLFLHASFGVQLVVIILLISSLYSWIIIIKKISLLRGHTSVLSAFEQEFWKGIGIANIYGKINKKSEKSREGIQIIFGNGFKRFLKVKSKISSSDHNKNKRMLQIIKATFDGEIAMQEQLMAKDLAILGTISSTAPYIGLFGTVWGILIAFWGFASETSVTMAVIAPHISEALIATAMGLLVAIPAQVAYNKFHIMSNEILDRYKNITHETMTLLNQQLLSEEDEEV